MKSQEIFFSYRSAVESAYLLDRYFSKLNRELFKRQGLMLFPYFYYAVYQRDVWQFFEICILI